MNIKNDIPMCQTCKYKNTNTQIHKVIVVWKTGFIVFVALEVRIYCLWDLDRALVPVLTSNGDLRSMALAQGFIMESS